MRIAVAAVALAVSASCSLAAEAGQLGKKAWNAWTCAFYAEKSGSPDIAERLFRVGLKAANLIADRQLSGDMSDDDFMAIPSGFTRVLKGPSRDFIVGRMFEMTQETAHEVAFLIDPQTLRRKQTSEMPSEAEQVKILNALYRNENCNAIR